MPIFRPRAPTLLVPGFHNELSAGDVDEEKAASGSASEVWEVLGVLKNLEITFGGNKYPALVEFLTAGRHTAAVIAMAGI